MKEKRKKIKGFLISNPLDFESSGSGLNSSCTIISGFALFCGIDDIRDLISILEEYYSEIEIETSSDFEEELTRVFDYAQNNSYGKFWETESAKKQYKF